MSSELVPQNAHLIPVQNHQFPGGMKPAVSAKMLYDFLGLHASQWKRWAKTNIVNNPYAIENEDYIIFDMMSNITPGRPTDDYAIGLDLAKKLSMMTRTDKGEEARNYFLECERVAQGEQPYQVVNPASRAMIDMIVRQDQLEQEVIALKERERQHDKQLIAQQAEIIRSLQQSQRAEEMAAMALDDSQQMTIREFVTSGKLFRQLPPNIWGSGGGWLGNFCRERNLKCHPPKRVIGQKWATENQYPMVALLAWLTSEANKGKQISIDGIEEDGVHYHE